MSDCFVAHRVDEDVKPTYPGSGHSKERWNPMIVGRKKPKTKQAWRNRRVAERVTTRTRMYHGKVENYLESSCHKCVRYTACYCGTAFVPTELAALGAMRQPTSPVPGTKHEGRHAHCRRSSYSTFLRTGYKVILVQQYRVPE